MVFELFLQQLRLLSSEEERKEGVLRSRRGVEVEKSRESSCFFLQHGSGTRILQGVAAQVSPGTYTKAMYREGRKKTFLRGRRRLLPSTVSSGAEFLHSTSFPCFCCCSGKCQRSLQAHDTAAAEVHASKANDDGDDVAIVVYAAEPPEGGAAGRQSGVAARSFPQGPQTASAAQGRLGL